MSKRGLYKSIQALSQLSDEHFDEDEEEEDIGSEDSIEALQEFSFLACPTCRTNIGLLSQLSPAFIAQINQTQEDSDYVEKD